MKTTQKGATLTFNTLVLIGFVLFLWERIKAELRDLEV